MNIEPTKGEERSYVWDGKAWLMTGNSIPRPDTSREAYMRRICETPVEFKVRDYSEHALDAMRYFVNSYGGSRSGKTEATRKWSADFNSPTITLSVDAYNRERAATQAEIKDAHNARITAEKELADLRASCKNTYHEGYKAGFKAQVLRCISESEQKLKEENAALKIERDGYKEALVRRENLIRDERNFLHGVAKERDELKKELAEAKQQGRREGYADRVREDKMFGQNNYVPFDMVPKLQEELKEAKAAYNRLQTHLTKMREQL